jgi:glycosyltransferase involved in cell wall biosynthesis
MSKVSVIIPTRNRCELLPRAVESARLAGSDVEIIVVDDASEDGTAKLCEPWARDGLIRYVRASRRLGPGGARNVGLLSTTAPYVSFLDDDDIRLSGSLDSQVLLLESEPEAGMIYGRALYGDENCQPTGDFYPEQCLHGDLFWELLRWNFIPCPTVVFRRACLTRVGLLEENAPGVEDWDLWVRIAELFPVLATEEAVAVWRRPNPSSRQFTSRGEKLHFETRRLHRDKWLRLPRALAASPEQRRQVKRDFVAHASQQLVWQAASNLKARRLAAFAQVTLASARMYPLGVSKRILSARAWQKHREAQTQNLSEKHL